MSTNTTAPLALSISVGEAAPFSLSVQAGSPANLQPILDALGQLAAPDLTPVLAAIAAIPAPDQSAVLAAIAAIPAPNESAVLAAIAAIPSSDPAPVLAAIAAIPTIDVAAVATAARLDAVEASLKASVNMLFAKGEVRPFSSGQALPSGWVQIAGDPPPAALPAGIGLLTNPTDLAYVPYDGHAVMLSDGLHMLCSSGSSHTRIVDELTLSSQTRPAPPSSANDSMIAGVLPSGKMLMGGGRHLNSPSIARLEAYIYAPATNTWTRVADMPATGMFQGVGHLLPSGKLAFLPYLANVAGAWDYSTVLYLYDEPTNTWTTVSHGGYQTGSTGLVSPSYSGVNTTLMGDGRVAFLEYRTGSSPTGFWALNPLTGAWADLGPRPVGYQGIIGWLAHHPDGLQVHGPAGVLVYSIATASWSTTNYLIAGTYNYNPVNSGSAYGWRNVKMQNGMYLQVVSTNNSYPVPWRYTCLGYNPSGTVYAKNNNNPL